MQQPPPSPSTVTDQGRGKRKSYIAAQAAIQSFSENLESKEAESDYDDVAGGHDDDADYRADIRKRTEASPRRPPTTGQNCGKCARCRTPSCGACLPCQAASGADPGPSQPRALCVLRHCLVASGRLRKIGPALVSERNTTLAAKKAPVGPCPNYLGIKKSNEGTQIDFKDKDQLMALLGKKSSEEKGPNHPAKQHTASATAPDVPGVLHGRQTAPAPPQAVTVKLSGSALPTTFRIASPGAGHSTEGAYAAKKIYREILHQTESQLQRGVSIVPPAVRRPLPPSAARGGAATRLTGLKLSMAPTPFPCTVCKLRFPSRLTMLSHRTVNHPNVAAVAPNRVADQHRRPMFVLSPPKKRPAEVDEDGGEDVFQRDLQEALRQSRQDMKQQSGGGGRDRGSQEEVDKT